MEDAEANALFRIPAFFGMRGVVPLFLCFQELFRQKKEFFNARKEPEHAKDQRHL